MNPFSNDMYGVGQPQFDGAGSGVLRGLNDIYTTQMGDRMMTEADLTNLMKAHEYETAQLDAPVKASQRLADIAKSQSDVQEQPYKTTADIARYQADPQKTQLALEQDQFARRTREGQAAMQLSDDMKDNPAAQTPEYWQQQNAQLKASGVSEVPLGVSGLPSLQQQDMIHRHAQAALTAGIAPRIAEIQAQGVNSLQAAQAKAAGTVEAARLRNQGYEDRTNMMANRPVTTGQPSTIQSFYSHILANPTASPAEKKAALQYVADQELQKDDQYKWLKFLGAKNPDAQKKADAMLQQKMDELTQGHLPDAGGASAPIAAPSAVPAPDVAKAKAAQSNPQAFYDQAKVMIGQHPEMADAVRARAKQYGLDPSKI